MSSTTVQFVDTNVLLYAVSRDVAEVAKSDTAQHILSRRDLAISAQVLQEFYVQATRATRPDRLTHQDAADLVTAFTRFRVLSVTAELVLRATAARERFQLSYWDAAIVEAARMLGCAELLSEDLNDGQDYDGVTVVNPFKV